MKTEPTLLTLPTRRLHPSPHARKLQVKMAWARDRQVQRLRPRLASFFVDQAQRVTDRYLQGYGLETKDEADRVFDKSQENLALARSLLIQLGVGALVADAIAAAFIDDGSPTEPQRIQALIARAGLMVVGINDYTLRSLRRTIAQGVIAGYTPYQIAAGVPADNFRGVHAVVAETYRGRPQAIARTEVGTIMNLASVDRYARGGMGLVEVMDGPDCGWFSHDDPDLADGSLRTVEAARATPLAHPNCRRIFLPYNPAWQESGARIIPVPEIVHYGG